MTFCWLLLCYEVMSSLKLFHFIERRFCPHTKEKNIKISGSPKERLKNDVKRCFYHPQSTQSHC